MPIPILTALVMDFAIQAQGDHQLAFLSRSALTLLSRSSGCNKMSTKSLILQSIPIKPLRNGHPG